MFGCGCGCARPHTHTHTHTHFLCFFFTYIDILLHVYYYVFLTSAVRQKSCLLHIARHVSYARANILTNSAPCYSPPDPSRAAYPSAHTRTDTRGVSKIAQRRAAAAAAARRARVQATGQGNVNLVLIRFSCVQFFWLR